MSVSETETKFIAVETMTLYELLWQFGLQFLSNYKQKNEKKKTRRPQ